MNNGHVPAWKRVGLKLKRSSEFSGTGDNVTAAPPSKKPKLNGSFDSADKTGLANPHTPAPTSTASLEHGPTSEQSVVNGSKKRKSVSFSSEAKSKDGPDLDYSEVMSTGGSEVQSKKQKLKKSKATSTGTLDPDDAPVGPFESSGDGSSSQNNAKLYLTYLDEYHNHKERWRFNKNRQTQVLHNLFNVYRIPPSYDAVLESYLSGLQGESRARLRADAQRALKDSAEADTHTSEKIRDVSTLKRNRAQMIISALGEDRGTPRQTPSNKPALARSEAEVPHKRSRGRKRRTVSSSLADDMDISSSSGSSSDSDSDSSDSSSDSSDDEASDSTSSASSSSESEDSAVDSSAAESSAASSDSSGTSGSGGGHAADG